MATYRPSGLASYFLITRNLPFRGVSGPTGDVCGTSVPFSLKTSLEEDQKDGAIADPVNYNWCR